MESLHDEKVTDDAGLVAELRRHLVGRIVYSVSLAEEGAEQVLRLDFDTGQSLRFRPQEGFWYSEAEIN